MTADKIEGVSYIIGNAFTTDPYRGNPAAVVFLKQELPDDVLQGIARNFNQPMTNFVYLPSVADQTDSQTASFRIRWFTSTVEAPLCGHGTLVAASTIFATPGLVAPSVLTLRFLGKSNTLIARRVDNKFELVLQAGDTERLPPAKEEKMIGIAKKALGEVNILSAWQGATGMWRGFLMLEIEEKGAGDLANRKIDCNVFAETGYFSNIVTARSSDPGVAFISRVFAPADGVPEDPVCGSAHSVMTPYWSEKLGFGEKQTTVKQVSPRGGDLGVRWSKSEGSVALRGYTITTMSGKLYL